jgi:hypothetical protein
VARRPTYGGSKGALADGAPARRKTQTPATSQALDRGPRERSAAESRSWRCVRAGSALACAHGAERASGACRQPARTSTPRPGGRVRTTRPAHCAMGMPASRPAAAPTRPPWLAPPPLPGTCCLEQSVVGLAPSCCDDANASTQLEPWQGSDLWLHRARRCRRGSGREGQTRSKSVNAARFCKARWARLSSEEVVNAARCRAFLQQRLQHNAAHDC